MDIGAALAGKMGPLPTWAWIGIGGVGVAGVGYLAKKKAGAAPAASAAAAPVAVNPFALLPSDLGGGGGGTLTNPPVDTTLPPTGGIEPPPPGGQSTTLPSQAPSSAYPRCIDAAPGQHCIETFINQGGELYFGISRPDIGQVPAGSTWWNNLSQTYSHEIEQIPHFQFQPGGTLYYGTPPPGVPTYGFPGVPATPMQT